jgi:soluble lytic murein transglycosylase-like protein
MNSPFQKSFGTRIKAIAFTLVASISFAHCASAEVYVIRNKDGSITFTSRQPAEGQQAEVFTPRKSGFSLYRVRSFLRSKLFKDQFHEIIAAAAYARGLDPNLIKAVIHAESAFNPRARSSKGAMGLMQLMPATAKLVGVKNPYEPRDNIFGGSTYLKALLIKYQGDLRRSLAAYNAGPGAVDSYGGIPPFPETRDYVHRVMELHRAYQRS